MADNIQTAKELRDTNVTNFESKLNQNVPQNEKSFIKVLSSVLALIQVPFFKYGAENLLQNFAITASGTGLDMIGREYGVIRKPSIAAVLKILLPAVNGTIIPLSIDYVGDSNAVRYVPDVAVIASSNVAGSNVTAKELGALGNLNVSDTMTIGSQIAGAETTATVSEIITSGTETESDETFRERVLNALRSTAGGGNASDYKTWAEEVSGVKKAYPFAGNPTPPSNPGDRIVYVEVDTTIDVDGVAPQSILDEVRATINADPDTGNPRIPLGLEDSTLFIKSITRIPIYVTITNFTSPSETLSQIQADVLSALTNHFLSISMFVASLDLPQNRNDLITDLMVAEVVQSVLKVNNASAEGVSFESTQGIPISSYRVAEGELIKLGSVTYA